ncbi:MAG: molybdopterin-dependent oxidoreductase [Treponema sp.]|nr:molybdopterin-dependent oxidoreductase [Treponema sp.]
MLQKLMNKEIGRRTFIKGGAAFAAAATAVLTGLPLASCRGLQHRAGGRPDLSGGEWMPADCWHNCGGRCLLKAYMVDGIPLQVKTDDTHPDTPNNPQQRACVRGRSQVYHVLGADRLKYPMKRKNWSPLGGGDKSLRGRDEWERISWDEAIAYIAAELKHAKANYGNSSIVGAGSAFLHSAEWGGFTTISDTASWGSFAYVGVMVGTPGNGFGGANCRMDLRRSETIIMVGCNPAWSSLGNPPYNIYQAKEAGANFIYVGPTYNYSADIYNAKWIRVRPAQDITLFLAVAHTMITEDNPATNPIIDWDFLNRCTYGFDANHMPPDARVNENFRDYVLGLYDGQPKTPEWASQICGTPPEDIRFLARELRKDKRVALLWGTAPARGNDAEDFPQIALTIGAMGGHLGKPGHATGGVSHIGSSNGGPSVPRLVSAGGLGVAARPTIFLPAANAAQESIMAPEIWDAILTGRYRRTDAFRHLGIESIGERDIDIRVIWHGGNHNILNTIVGTVKGIEAHRKVDFVMTRALSLNDCAKYSDIVLPLTSMWERPGAVRNANRDAIFYSHQLMERMYEGKSDYEIDELIAHALGMSTASEMYPMNEGLQLLNSLAGCTVRNADNTGNEPLVTLTAEDLRQWGEKWGTVHISPQQGRISLPAFAQAGVFQFPRSEGDNFYHINYQAFRENPEAAPLTTATGRIEIYSQRKADVLNAMGRSVIRPYPTYRPALNGYEDSFRDWGNRIKGEYPYQMTTPHYQRRAHSIFDNVPVMREAFTSPCYLNPQDAAAKGIRDGDTVLIYSRYAKTLRPACLSERLMPGTVEISHGAWLDINEETGIDRAGSENYISAHIATGMGISGYNTQLVNFEKYSGSPLQADHLVPLRIVNI